MKILGNRVLVSKIEEEKTEGFQTVQVQDSFVYKGKIEILGDVSRKISYATSEDIQNIRQGNPMTPTLQDFEVGSIILFAKYSPDTHEITHEGKTMKVVDVSDILAVL